MAWGTALLRWMTSRASLRVRLAAGLILLGAAVLGAFALVVSQLVEQQEEEFINEILAAEMERFAGGGSVSDTDPVTMGRIKGYVTHGGKEPDDLPQEVRDLAPGIHELFVGGKEYHVAVRRDGGAAHYLVYDVTRHDARVDSFQNALLVGLAASLAALVALSIWVSGVLTRQLGDLAQQVRHLDPGTPQAPLTPHYRDREVVTLAAALDEYARRVAALVAREKEFTANLSHELRTPLTTIKTGCELLAQDPGISERSRFRVRTIAASADEITELIDALLLLGRETPVEAEDLVELAELAEEAAAPLRPAFEAKGLRLVIDVPSTAVARVNRTALQLTLANLLKNAVAYTDRGEVRVRYVDGALAVSDTGVGIAAADLPRIFERAFRGANARAGGTGLGLAIVKRIAERFGWRIDAESAPGRGTTFRVLLATSPSPQV
jgi:signal transduction histidine kinase